MAGTKLKFVETITNGLQIGVKNAVSLIGAVVLWAFTCWIPYINVGTTIGLVGIVAKMGRGGSVSPLEIFDSKYRKQMGEFFLVVIFMYTGILVGFLFGGIPGYVIIFAWSLAPLLVLDQGVNPIEALQRSNDLMDGNKWQFFGANFVIGAAAGIPALIILLMMSFINHWIVGLFGFLCLMVLYVLVMAAQLGVAAYVYATLVPGGDAGEE